MAGTASTHTPKRLCRLCGGDGFVVGIDALKRGTTSPNNECPACKGEGREEMPPWLFTVYVLRPDRRFVSYHTDWAGATAKADAVRTKDGAEIWTIHPDRQVAHVGRGGAVTLRPGFDPDAHEKAAR